MKPKDTKRAIDQLIGDIVCDALLIGCDFSGGNDIDIVTVAKRVNGKMKFINVIQGEEAWILYRRLITFKVKMDIKEATQLINELSNSAGYMEIYGGASNEPMNVALGIAVDSMQKQEPMKPIYDRVEGKCCPNCFERATFQTWKHGYPVVIKMNYCQACGQAIDWREE